MGDLILRTDENGIAILTLNRPEALNALSPNLFIELREHIEAINTQSEETGCVILRGAGRSFSAGNDLKAIQSGETAPSRHFQAETLELLENNHSLSSLQYRDIAIPVHLSSPSPVTF